MQCTRAVSYTHLDVYKRQPMNKGIMIQGKRKRINYKVRKVIEKPQEQWNIKHNAVVTPMPLLCYDNVQRLLEQDIRVAPGQENVYLFAGMVYCADCGRSMTRRKTNENIFYICTTDVYKRQLVDL